MNPNLKQCPQCHTMKEFSTHLCFRCLDINEARREVKGDIQSVLAMIEGDTDRVKIANYIKEYLLK